MGQHMADDIKQKVSKIKSVNEVQVDVTFDPLGNKNDDRRCKRKTRLSTPVQMKNHKLKRNGNND